EPTAARVRDQAVGPAQQRALARSRGAHDEQHLAGRDGEVDAVEGGRDGVRVGERQRPKSDAAHVFAPGACGAGPLGHASARLSARSLNASALLSVALAANRPAIRREGATTTGAASGRSASPGRTWKTGQRNGLVDHTRLESPASDSSPSATGAHIEHA